MDDIIKTSDLSAGAVYSYYASKEDIIFSAVTASLSGLRERLEPILKERPIARPDIFIGQIAEAIAGFTAREGYDLKRIALLGWSEAQRNDRLRLTMQDFYLAFREMLIGMAEVWKEAGHLQQAASASDVAKAVLSGILGFVVQSAIVGGVEPSDLAGGFGDLIKADSDE